MTLLEEEEFLFELVLIKHTLTLVFDRPLWYDDKIRLHFDDEHEENPPDNPSGVQDINGNCF